MDKEMKTTMIREMIKIRKELDERGDQNSKKGISGSERGEWGAKERINDSERGDERKRRKRAVGEGRLGEMDENDRGKDGTKRKEGEEE
jgi:hypothetical protein